MAEERYTVYGGGFVVEPVDTRRWDTVIDLLTDDAKAALERINTRYRNEHIWNMVVLAAESSRYG